VVVLSSGNRVVEACTPMQELIEPTSDSKQQCLYFTATLDDNPAGPRDRRTPQEIEWDDGEDRCVHTTRAAVFVVTATGLAATIALYIPGVFREVLVESSPGWEREHSQVQSQRTLLLAFGASLVSVVGCASCLVAVDSTLAICRRNATANNGCWCTDWMPPEPMLRWFARRLSGRMSGTG